ncbi:hypothetical protein KIMH_03200 [Bombiscardovia apis]|uniref:Uncharacterized protein n=1 Tax=Bombiscardovia apis TaxID=2932182 RepID=A0ABM8BC39_9BIFI|nr:hypothetical protein [Bombiscardovia apis]BDR54209.1 hypothetical protein KIMH_03200 [Bombiscardovia apis]
MKYITSIIATLFSLIGCIAFGTQLYGYGFAPPAQFIVMVFLLGFNAMIWLADARRGSVSAAHNMSLYHRIIAEQTVFPTVGYLIQAFIACLYFCAWNVSWTAPTVGLRAWLPAGFFIPLVVECVVTAILSVLWLSNIRINAHTIQQEAVYRSRYSQREQLKALVMQLESRVDLNESEAALLTKRICRKVDSLPLVPNPTTEVFRQQAVQEIHSVLGQPDTVHSDSLRRIWSDLSKVK